MSKTIVGSRLATEVVVAKADAPPNLNDAVTDRELELVAVNGSILTKFSVVASISVLVDNVSVTNLSTFGDALIVACVVIEEAANFRRALASETLAALDRSCGSITV